MIMTAYAAPVYYSGNVNNYVVHAGYEWAGSECDPAHDTSRNVQKEGVGNPFNYGERNTPANASTAEIRAINHKMTVQEVKYALYKEIDEHWALISKRLGQTDSDLVQENQLSAATVTVLTSRLLSSTDSALILPMPMVLCRPLLLPSLTVTRPSTRKIMFRKCSSIPSMNQISTMLSFPTIWVSERYSTSLSSA